MHIQHLDIKNLRCFERTSLDFRFPEEPDNTADYPNVNLLLGNNGAGKSTVLKAVALAVLSPVIQSAGFQPYRLVRRVSDQVVDSATVQARVALHSQDFVSTERKSDVPIVEHLSTSVSRIRDGEFVEASNRPEGHWELMYDDRSPAFLLVGYGASRQVESSSSFDRSLRSHSRLLRYERVAGLFDEGVTLTPLGSWLPQLKPENPGRYKQTVTLLDKLLPDECRFTGEVEGSDYVFRFRGAPVTFAALSDGYRAYIGWIGDLLYHITFGAPSGARLDENVGVVMVDEIDLHIHPEWQRSIVPRLSKALPRMQFILTTHSPIVTGTLQSQNIFVMETTENGASRVEQIDESVRGKSSEQILLSPYFDLTTTRSSEMETELSSLSKKARSGDSDAAYEFLQHLGRGLPE